MILERICVEIGKLIKPRRGKSTIPNKEKTCSRLPLPDMTTIIFNFIFRTISAYTNTEIKPRASTVI